MSTETEAPTGRQGTLPDVGRRLAAAAFVLGAVTGVGLPPPATDPPTTAGLALPAAGLAGAAPAVGLAGTAPAAPALRGDDVRDQQWHLRSLGLSAAWGYASGKGVTVAVIDSGVDASHPDLAGQVLPGEDLVAGTGDGRTDPVGHGTTVAAIIAGRGDDADGVIGLAPEAKILPVRVLDQQNRYDDALIVAQAVRWAVDNGARVINLSLGGNGSSAALAAAIDYAFAKDVVVVACTGNLSATGATEVWYPAREPGVLAVAGLDRNGKAPWTGSITGEQTVLAAPATELLGARPGGYWRVQGTSFAAPMVSGVAALIRSRWPALPAADVVNRLIETARDLGPVGRDEQFGFGLVDPLAALTAPLNSVSHNPLDTTPPPGVARLGAAPGSGAQHPTDGALPGPVGGRLPGTNPGSAASPAAPARQADPPGWWGAAALFAVSAVVGLTALRRLSTQP